MTCTLSILIVNWNSKVFLRKCLQSVRTTCTDIQLQIVVVDGGSHDGCAEMLAAEFPEVEFVQSDRNIGFGRANNLGFQSVKGELLLLLNPDCELLPGSVRSLRSAMAQLPGAGLVAPRLLNSDASLQTSCVQAFPTPLNQALDAEFLRRRFPRARLWGTCKAFASSEPVAVEAVSGACMLLESSVFRSLEGFSPVYFMYGEDMDLCARVQAAGLRVYHVPAAAVIHHGGGSSRGEFSRFSAVFLRQSVYSFIRHHQGRAAAACYRALMMCVSISRLALLSPTLLVRRPEHGRNHHGSFKKWLAVLRWSVGLERWTSNYA